MLVVNSTSTFKNVCKNKVSNIAKNLDPKESLKLNNIPTRIFTEFCDLFDHFLNQYFNACLDGKNFSEIMISAGTKRKIKKVI